jgi:UDP:flavonoid glycosyltransferase YjiC (YdhE family)
LDAHRPTLYVTLGSSGRVQRLPLVIAVAARLGFQVLVATAGRGGLPATLPPHVHAADFLPGDLAASRALAVISNGGSTTGYQALSQGRPVLGIASNLDQHLAMNGIQRAGAGLLLRAGTLDAPQLEDALTQVITQPSFAAHARSLGQEFARWNSAATFQNFVDRACA